MQITKHLLLATLCSSLIMPIGYAKGKPSATSLEDGHHVNLNEEQEPERIVLLDPQTGKFFEFSEIGGSHAIPYSEIHNATSPSCAAHITSDQDFEQFKKEFLTQSNGKRILFKLYDLGQDALLLSSDVVLLGYYTTCFVVGDLLLVYVFPHVGPATSYVIKKTQAMSDYLLNKMYNLFVPQWNPNDNQALIDENVLRTI